MKGIKYLIDDAGEKSAVLIDLKRHSELWEDFYDSIVAQQRRHEPRESLDKVRERLIQAGKLRANVKVPR